MANPNFAPHTIYEAQRQIIRAQPTTSDDKKPFANGAFPDMDPSALPPRSVHVVKNYRVHPDKLLTRPGSKRWSDSTLPFLVGRTGYALSKSGTTVTKTVGTNFSVNDVGSFIVHDDGVHERIEQYLTVNTVRVSTSTAHAASTAGWMRGAVNALLWHKTKKIILMLIDSRIFYSDVLMTSWTEIPKAHINPVPMSDVSRLRAFDDYAVLFNGTGMQKIDLVEYVYWKMNSACPSVRITDQPRDTTKAYCRNYVYSAGRIGGTSQTADRYSSGIEIKQETGTVGVDTSGKDHGSVWTVRPVGRGDTTFGRLTGGAVIAPYDTSAGWSGISDGQFTVSINGTSRQITCDFTSCTTMAQVAEQIQLSLRDFFPKATCVWNSDRFVIESPEETGTVSYTSAGGAGYTDISTAMFTYSDVAVSVDNILFTAPVTIGELELPVDPTTGDYDAQHDIFSIYSTLDIGDFGSDPTTGEGNNDQLYVWQADIPVAKAFVASMTYSLVELEEGSFQNCDVGCKIRFQNGFEATISSIMSTTQAVVLEWQVITSQAAAIGGDESLGKAIRVMTASQSDSGNPYNVTISGGTDHFISSDVGRSIFWPSGNKSLITEYISPTVVRVQKSEVIASTGCCIHPKTRKYTDDIRDEAYNDQPNLRTRITSYTLQNRFFEPMPDCNMGEVTSSMIFGIERGGNTVYYCAADVNYRHQAGYHYRSKQRSIFQDAIHEISEISNTLSVKCSRSTRAIATNQFNSYQISAAGTAIILATNPFMVDERVGVKHFGGVLPIDKSRQLVITSEPAVRRFDGTAYGDNLAADRIQKIIEGCQAAYSMSYDTVNGATIWMLQE